MLLSRQASPESLENMDSLLHASFCQFAWDKEMWCTGQVGGGGSARPQDGFGGIISVCRLPVLLSGSPVGKQIDSVSPACRQRCFSIIMFGRVPSVVEGAADSCGIDSHCPGRTSSRQSRREIRGWGLANKKAQHPHPEAPHAWAEGKGWGVS